MSALSLKVYESGVTCNACVLQIIWKPDAFNEITDEPEQDDDGPQHTKRPGCFFHRRCDVGDERFWNRPNARRHANTVEMTVTSSVSDDVLADAFAEVPYNEAGILSRAPAEEEGALHGVTV